MTCSQHTSCYAHAVLTRKETAYKQSISTFVKSPASRSSEQVTTPLSLGRSFTVSTHGPASVDNEIDQSDQVIDLSRPSAVAQRGKLGLDGGGEDWVEKKLQSLGLRWLWRLYSLSVYSWELVYLLFVGSNLVCIAVWWLPLGVTICIGFNISVWRFFEE
jgi:hypothetical protein